MGRFATGMFSSSSELSISIVSVRLGERTSPMPPGRGAGPALPLEEK